jgi:hypothetical protein
MPSDAGKREACAHVGVGVAFGRRAVVGGYAILDAQPGGVFHLDINGVSVRGRFLDSTHRTACWSHGVTPAPIGCRPAAAPSRSPSPRSRPAPGSPSNIAACPRTKPHSTQSAGRTSSAGSAPPGPATIPDPDPFAATALQRASGKTEVGSVRRWRGAPRSGSPASTSWCRRAQRWELPQRAAGQNAADRGRPGRHRRALGPGRQLRADDRAQGLPAPGWGGGPG